MDHLTADGPRCGRCHSDQLRRSHSRSDLQKFFRRHTGFDRYACSACGHRGWTWGKVPRRETARAVAAFPPQSAAETASRSTGVGSPGTAAAPPTSTAVVSTPSASVVSPPGVTASTGRSAAAAPPRTAPVVPPPGVTASTGRSAAAVSRGSTLAGRRLERRDHKLRRRVRLRSFFAVAVAMALGILAAVYLHRCGASMPALD